MTPEKLERMHAYSDQVNSNNEQRLKELEGDGVVAEVMFSGGPVPFTGFFGNAEAVEGEELELAMAGQRAHNRWLGEFIDPSRQVGVALINYADVDAAVREVYWAANAGLRSVMVNGVQTSVPPPWDDRYTPLWNAIEDTGLPISLHAGSGSTVPMPAGVNQPRDFSSRSGHLRQVIKITEGPFATHRALWFFVWGGILESHPNLKLVFTETGSGWVAKAVTYMDWQWEYSAHSESDLVPRRPSEYWQRQCFVGASIMTHHEVAHRHEIGVPQMMFGTDFPHPEGTLGKTISYLNHVLAGTDITEAELRAILGENAARCYGLDMTYLQSLANKVGPTMQEIMAVSDTPVDDPETTMWAAKPSFVF
jgi:predicted TIM-barrel fold metal-dependent hydrolase